MTTPADHTATLVATVRDALANGFPRNEWFAQLCDLLEASERERLGLLNNGSDLVNLLSEYQDTLTEMGAPIENELKQALGVKTRLLWLREQLVQPTPPQRGGGGRDGGR